MAIRLYCICLISSSSVSTCSVMIAVKYIFGNKSWSPMTRSLTWFKDLISSSLSEGSWKSNKNIPSSDASIVKSPSSEANST